MANTHKMTEEEREIYKQKRLEFNRESFKELLSRDLPHECHVCGCTDESKLTYHHIVPLALGGTNSLRNIIVLCVDCHAKTHMRLSAFADKSRTGRHTTAPPNYKDILERYIEGDIGRSECERLMGFKKTSKIHDSPLYQRFLDEKGIAKVRNLIDIKTCKSPKIKVGAKIVEITYKDGASKEIYYTGHNFKKIIYKKAI